MVNVLKAHATRTVIDCASIKSPTPYQFCKYAAPHHELIFVCSGRWHIVDRSETYNLKAGDVLFLHSGRHDLRVSECSEDFSFFFIHFTRVDSDDVLDSEEEDVYNQDNTYLIDTVVHCNERGRVYRDFESIVHDYWSSRDDKLVRLNILLDLLINDVAYANRKDYQPGYENIERVLRTFRITSDRFFRVEEAAQIAGMSTRSLSEWFKRATGQSVYRYQINFKLEMAYKLLQRQPNHTMQEVANTFGFYDAFQFSKLFKQKYGYPPKELRKRTRSGAVDNPQED